MILKELDPASPTDPLAKSGRRAEEQMAFYLRREFAGDRDIRVIHDLRFIREGEVAQIDHLVVHRWGVVIVESKSVTSQVRINERHEWTRWWNGREHGMPSPVLQGERQGKLLRHLLNDHAEQVVGKMLGLVQVRFGFFPVDVVVAISDDGVIKQPKKAIPDVLKADQVPGRIRALIDFHRKDSSLLNMRASGSLSVSAQEVENISHFLISQHQPLQQTTTISIPEPMMAPEIPLPAKAERLSETSPQQATSPACRQCGSNQIFVEYGRYGYYFKCRECDGNTPIKVECLSCHTKAKIRKSGMEFFVTCEACDSERAFWTNASAAV